MLAYLLEFALAFQVFARHRPFHLLEGRAEGPSTLAPPPTTITELLLQRINPHPLLSITGPTVLLVRRRFLLMGALVLLVLLALLLLFS
jgi:hypothetical protein